MKHILLIAATLLMGSCVNAQKIKESEVPAAVKSTFMKMHPNVPVKWEKENGNFEANFEIKENETSVLINASGELIETENEMAVNKLPAAVLNYLKTNKPNEKIKEASMITDAKGVVTYEAELKEGDFIFDKEGKFLRITKD